MKIKTSISADKLASCFRAGMAAHEVTTSLLDVARILREPVIKKAAKELRNQGAKAFEKARVEALRVREMLPVGGGNAGIVARKAQKFAEQLRKPTVEIDFKYLRDFRGKFQKLGDDIKRMYRESLERCGKSVPEDKILQTLYPEIERRK